MTEDSRGGRSVEPLHWGVIDTPIGHLGLASDGRVLVAILFEEEIATAPARLARRGAIDLREPDELVRRASAQLDGYFAGDITAFHLPLEPGGTPGQRAVWDAVKAIPSGSVRTYRVIARALGRDRAARAVGAANARNPLPIVIPCHRVIGADGTLRGYAGGVERKLWLLTHEGAPVAQRLPSAEAARALAEPQRIGVPSTGIYCRPSCRYTPRLRRPPLAFADAAAAQSAGFRPCRVCLP